MKARVFIAINLTADLNQKIIEKTRILRKFDLPISWVKEENLHLTLKFLGNLEKSELKIAGESLDKIFINRLKSFTLKISNLDIFPKVNPKIVSLKMKHSKTLSEIVLKLESKLNQLSFIKKENRKFKPHLTIGRVKKRVNNWPKEIKNLELEEKFHVTKIDLMKSELDSKGPRYSILKSYHLNK